VKDGILAVWVAEDGEQLGDALETESPRATRARKEST